MPFTNYAIAALISFSGLIVGIFIAKMAQEELKDGRKYFVALQKLILVAILFVILYFYNVDLELVIVLSLVFAAIIHFYFDKIPGKTIYPFLAVVFAISYGVEKLFFTEAALIFIYGLPTAALLVNFRKKNYWKIVVHHVGFVIVALLLYIVYAVSF